MAETLTQNPKLSIPAFCGGGATTAFLADLLREVKHTICGQVIIWGWWVFRDEVGLVIRVFPFFRWGGGGGVPVHNELMIEVPGGGPTVQQQRPNLWVNP